MTCDGACSAESASYTTSSGGHQPGNESYSFDANGNRNSTGYTTSSDNQTSSDGTYTYTYDADGNRLTRTQISGSYSTDYTTTYTWDYRNRLTDVENYDNSNALKQHVHYVYDVFDHLIATEVDLTGGGSYTQIKHYVLDLSPEIPAAGVPSTASAEPVLVFNGSSNLIGRNLVALNAAQVDAVVAQGTVASLSTADTVNWDLTDDIGSLRLVLDSASNVIDEMVYNSFGQIAYESAPSIDHFAGFAGGHVDASTGLVDNYHRWYDPAVGRWLSQDPADFRGGDANLSRYVENNPRNVIDPAGLAPPLGSTSDAFGYNPANDEGTPIDYEPPAYLPYDLQTELVDAYNIMGEMEAELQDIIITSYLGYLNGVQQNTTYWNCWAWAIGQGNTLGCGDYAGLMSSAVAQQTPHLNYLVNNVTTPNGDDTGLLVTGPDGHLYIHVVPVNALATGVLGILPVFTVEPPPQNMGAQQQAAYDAMIQAQAQEEEEEEQMMETGEEE